MLMWNTSPFYKLWQIETVVQFEEIPTESRQGGFRNKTPSSSQKYGVQTAMKKGPSKTLDG